MSDRHDDQRLPAGCRAFRAAPDAAHALGCPACADALALRARLGAAIRAIPTPPSALASRAFLASIHERIVEGIEADSAIAARIAEPVRTPADLAPHPAELGAALASALTTAPAGPAEIRWRDVRRAVIEDIAGRRTARARVVVWLGLLGAAAAALFVVSTNEADPASAPRIVFADLAAPPTGDFAIVRRGADR